MTASDERNRDVQADAMDRDLRALFAPHRPDPDAFRAGIAARLAADQGGGAAPDTDDGDPVPQARSGNTLREPRAGRLGYQRLLDRAASVLPGLKASSAGKPWLGVLSMPVVLVVGTLVAFAHAFQAVDPRRYDQSASAGHSHRFAKRLLLTLLPMLGSLLGLGLMAWTTFAGNAHVLDVVTLVFLVAMLALSGHIAAEAKDGVVQAVQTSRTVVLLLLAMLFAIVWLPARLATAGDAAFGHGAIGWILVAGVVSATLLSWRMANARDVGFGLLLGFVLPLLTISLPLPAAPEARLVAVLARDDLVPENLAGWSELERAGRALHTAGVALPALDATRQRLVTALAKNDASLADDDVHPQVWTTAVALNLLDEVQLRTLATRTGVQYRVDQLLRGEAPLAIRGYDGFLLDCLMAKHELTTAERAHLAQRIVAGWPSPEELHAIETALTGARWLVRLGAHEDLAASRERLQEILRRHWVGIEQAAWHTAGGGFTQMVSTHSPEVATTVEAIALMRYAGVPTGIPLRHIDGYLRSQRHTSAIGRLLTLGPRPQADADAGLVELRRGLGLPARGWLEALVAERCALAAALLVLLGLRAILVAHRAEQQVRGALP